jgi:hypothetical protein
MQLKYNETGREKDCLPRVGQWNMLNKVTSQTSSAQEVRSSFALGTKTTFYLYLLNYCLPQLFFSTFACLNSKAALSLIYGNNRNGTKS